MNIWIFNHYATDMYFDGAGRHQSFAKYLLRNGHDVKIFCASTVHNSDINVDTNNGIFVERLGKDNVSYVFVKTPEYKGNGFSRIKNMVEFYLRIFKVAKIYSKCEKPDIILASSVHPLTLVAGIQFGKKNKIPCICEVRDLWPETLVEMGIIDRNSLIAKALYLGEKWIYKRADKLIFTMPGGKEYLKDMNMTHLVSLDKVYNINNGVDLELYDVNKQTEIIDDTDLTNESLFKIIYTGSVRSANHVDDLLEVAKILKEKGKNKIKIIVYGDGDQKEKLENEAKQFEINNIVFKGRADKKYIPYILSQGNLNVVTGKDSEIGRYGISWNKLFEYMASGKPIIANYTIARYNFIDEYNIGIANRFETLEKFAEAIIRIAELPEAEYKDYGLRALKAASDFDYKNLTNKLEEILIQTKKEYSKN